MTIQQKYKLTSETKEWVGRTLYRIEALISFGTVEAGDKGGFVENSENLSQDGDAWVYGDAWVSPVNLIGVGGAAGYSVTIIDRHMQIGCEFHLIAEWDAFDNRRIAEMDGLRSYRFWKTYRDPLMGLCRSERPDAFKSESEVSQ